MKIIRTGDDVTSFLQYVIDLRIKYGNGFGFHYFNKNIGKRVKMFWSEGKFYATFYGNETHVLPLDNPRAFVWFHRKHINNVIRKMKGAK